MSLLARILIALSLCVALKVGMAQVVDTSARSQDAGPRHLSLPQAVQLAQLHNHSIRIAEARVDEKKRATEVAKSAYLPTVRNESTAFVVTDTQFIELPAGSLGTVPPNQLVPNHNIIISQGGEHFITSGTGLTQPLTQLFKIRSANEITQADYRASHNEEQVVEDDVALKVQETYYRLLILQLSRKSAKARITAVAELQQEREQQVKLGSALEEDVIETRAQSLQARQALLTTDLQLSDLTLLLNDLVGLPLNTALALEEVSPEVSDVCDRNACVESARASHPEIAQARAEMDKAVAAVRLAKQDYIPDVTAFARYSHQENVPFLARNFGTFGVGFGYTLFDGGRRRATVREAESALVAARENLYRVTDEVALGVETAYNKLDRTREMVKVSRELLSLREESTRVIAQQLARGNALESQADSAEAQSLEARTQLLQSQMDFVQARDELSHAMGRVP